MSETLNTFLNKIVAYIFIFLFREPRLIIKLMNIASMEYNKLIKKVGQTLWLSKILIGPWYCQRSLGRVARQKKAQLLNLIELANIPGARLRTPIDS